MENKEQKQTSISVNAKSISKPRTLSDGKTIVNISLNGKYKGYTFSMEEKNIHEGKNGDKFFYAPLDVEKTITKYDFDKKEVADTQKITFGEIKSSLDRITISLAKCKIEPCKTDKMKDFSNIYFAGKSMLVYTDQIHDGKNGKFLVANKTKRVNVNEKDKDGNWQKKEVNFGWAKKVIDDMSKTKEIEK